jgi:hypothetical protein
LRDHLLECRDHLGRHATLVDERRQLGARLAGSPELGERGDQRDARLEQRGRAVDDEPVVRDRALASRIISRI